MKLFRVRHLAARLSLSATILLASCAAPTADNELYLALGGHDGIERITENFIMEIAGDDRVIDHFADSNVQRFREKFAEHFCMVVDGPCQYTGDTMIEIHTGMGVTEGDFNAVVEDLMAAMGKAQVPIGTQNRVLARLATLRGEVIYQ
jgi:hemoglobin